MLQLNNTFLLRKISSIIFLFCLQFTFAQNKQVLYDFANLPQNLMQNPGANFSPKWHVGIPFLSQISVHAGNTMISAYDIFKEDGVNINTKLRGIINKLDTKDFLAFNQQLEIINGGFKLKNNSYLSFGFYQELDIVVHYPKDIVQLFYEGNTILDKRYSLKGLNAKVELLGVWHVGLSKKINEKTTFGGRLKFYTGVANVQTKNNSGTLYTTQGTNNIYTHELENIQVSTQTSGVILDDYDVDSSYFLRKLFFGNNNVGFGIDVGFTHNISEQLQLSGSLLDIGMVSYAKDTENYVAEGNYTIEGLNLLFDQDNPQDYWNVFEDDFEANIPLDTLNTHYVSWRPAKLNAAIKYRFNDSNSNNCHFYNKNENYSDAVGMQLFSTLRSYRPTIAATLFYEKRFGRHLFTKLTYTADSYSYTNIGFGIAANINIFNIYLTADNLLNVSNLAKAKSASLQFGMHIIFDKK